MVFLRFVKNQCRKFIRKQLKKRFGSVGVNARFPIKKKNYVEIGSIFLGNHISIGTDCLLVASQKGKIIVKDGTILAPRCKVYTRNHNYDSEYIESIPYDHVQICSDVVIEEGVWIGESVLILPGVTIGKGAVIGGGSVVSKDIPPYAVAVGNPARVVKYRDKERFDRLLEAKAFVNALNKQKFFVNESEINT